jgi:predicted transcriptional regulator
MPIKYRSRVEIMAQILQAANGRHITKTRIMYSVFLSYEQLKEYLAILIQNGLLEYWEGTQTYKTAEKGLKFLRIYELMKEELATAAAATVKTKSTATMATTTGLLSGVVKKQHQDK